MAAVNRVTLIGNLGRNPEVRQTPSGSKVVTFSIATTEHYKDQQGNRQEKTEWHNIVAWNKQAEVLEQYARKGMALYIEGSLQTQSWGDESNGGKRYKTQVVVKNFQFLGGQGKRDNSGGSSNQGSCSAPSVPTNDGGFGGDFGNMSDPDGSLPF